MQAEARLGHGDSRRVAEALSALLAAEGSRPRPDDIAGGRRRDAASEAVAGKAAIVSSPSGRWEEDLQLAFVDGSVPVDELAGALHELGRVHVVNVTSPTYRKTALEMSAICAKTLLAVEKLPRDAAFLCLSTEEAGALDELLDAGGGGVALAYSSEPHAGCLVDAGDIVIMGRAEARVIWRGEMPDRLWRVYHQMSFLDGAELGYARLSSILSQLAHKPFTMMPNNMRWWMAAPREHVARVLSRISHGNAVMPDLSGPYPEMDVARLDAQETYLLGNVMFDAGDVDPFDGFDFDKVHDAVRLWMPAMSSGTLTDDDASSIQAIDRFFDAREHEHPEIPVFVDTLYAGVPIEDIQA